MKLKTIETALLENKDMLYRTAAKYLKNHEDVLDALQDTAYKAIKNSHKLKNEEYALTWVVRILINTCLQSLKKNKTYETIEFDESILHEGSTVMSTRIELTELLLNLNKNYRNAIIMKYIEGYKIREIAHICNKPEGTIKTWLRRGLETLGKEVESYE